jgi:hypothetical protein
VISIQNSVKSINHLDETKQQNNTVPYRTRYLPNTHVENMNRIIGILCFAFCFIIHDVNGINSKDRKLIIGGDDAPPNKYNWFVRLGNIGGGVLVAPGFFITKASYVDDIREIDIVRIGALCYDDNNNNCGQYYEDRSVQDMFVHPEYENGGPNLMLVKLTQSSTVNPAIMDEGSLASLYENGERL